MSSKKEQRNPSKKQKKPPSKEKELKLIAELKKKGLYCPMKPPLNKEMAEYIEYLESAGAKKLSD